MTVGTSTVFAATWDYNNRLRTANGGGTASAYLYDPSGQRLRSTVTSTAVTTTYYPTTFYNVSGTTSTKQIFAGNMLIGTVTKQGATTTVYSVMTDHLTGSSVITSASGTLAELTDYMPFGVIRLDEQPGGFSEQRKYIGQEYDVETGLSYLNARYYDGVKGKFISQDPEAKDNPKKFLQDPQQLNYYSYARNNPITLSDPNGRCVGPLLLACIYAIETAPVWVPAAITAIAGVGAAYATHEVAGAAGSYLEGDGKAGDASINRAMTTFGTVASFGEGAVLMQGAVDKAAIKKQDLVEGIDQHGSYEKHVIRQGEYGSRFADKDQWKDYVNGVISKPSASYRGPTKDLYWDNGSESIVIDNKAGGPPTAFRPQTGKVYYDAEVSKQQTEYFSRIKAKFKGGGRP